jgi:SprT protein
VFKPNDLTPAQIAHKDKLVIALSAYLPPEALSLCAELIMYYKLHLHIEVERKGRYGDYTPHSGKGSRISINHNLSPFEFLITFVHELAHHTAFLKDGSRHEPHAAVFRTRNVSL